MRAADGGGPWFSPSGRLLAALCADPPAAACVLDAATGEHRARVPLPGGGVLWGWFNEDHLVGFHDGQADILDLTGRRARLLAEIRAPADDWLVHFTGTG
ncbi:hypothetical protein Misp01_53330 [Microtetraspora sp. NBRC 13810]|uniref:hypothetical protein n=1 Tax=Microtetraspora sp. NBRC 13810 TaxID=3030990 RepID=UPI0025578BF4|nr:hypothetical protein [Microtetraspora sp. NBRC 13810]GLW10205.1 hypothetical protein Misp01_53330 [Microtetraspora sp. NBRC 13810]